MTLDERGFLSYKHPIGTTDQSMNAFLNGRGKKLLACAVAGIVVVVSWLPSPMAGTKKGSVELPSGWVEVEDLTAGKWKGESGRRSGTYAAKKKRWQASRALLREKRKRKRWKQVTKKTKSLLTLVHYDQFVIRTLPTQESIYIPGASLVTDPSSVAHWTEKLSHSFDSQKGTSTLLHLKTVYYDEKEGVVYPNYALQLNLEVPAGLFRSRKRIPARALKGYLSWVHPDFPDGNLFLSPSRGHLFLWRIKKGYLMGRVNLKFDHAELGEPIHLYGRVRAYRMSGEEFAAREGRVRGEMIAGVMKLDRIPVHRDRLKPRYDYKSRKTKDPWVTGRSSDLWRESREGL